MLQYAAIIPARGESKGLPRKNLRNLGPCTLLEWTIRASLGSSIGSSVYVSSENPETLSVAEELGATPLARPINLSLDNTSTLSVVSYVIGQIGQFDAVVILPPTSPFRSFRHIDEAVTLFESKHYDFLVSVGPSREPAELLIKVDREGQIQNVLGVDVPTLRQEFTPTYKLNGAISILRSNILTETRNLNTVSRYPFVMDGVSSVDIDDLSDVRAAEEIYAAGQLRISDFPWLSLYDENEV